MAGKLKTLSKKEVLVNEIIMAGIQSLSAGENPRIMERRLMGFLSPKDRTSNFD
jgi:chemotaxis protein MotA